MGKDQAKRKMKGGSASSASSFDVRELAKIMASEYVMASDPYNTQKNQEMSELLKIKNRELKLKAAELKIRRMENRQRDEAWPTLQHPTNNHHGRRKKKSERQIDGEDNTIVALVEDGSSYVISKKEFWGSPGQQNRRHGLLDPEQVVFLIGSGNIGDANETVYTSRLCISSSY
ncbi:hypothetical protein Tco_1409285 [Tanacetum coccineum]